MRTLGLALLLLAPALAGCAGPPQVLAGRACEARPFAPGLPGLAGGPENLTFATGDGVTLRGELWPRDGNHAAVLVHGLNEDRRAVAELALRLWERGFTVLAFDLRGHGESRERRGQPYERANFTHEDFLAMEQDVAAAVEVLRGRYAPACMALVGASLGGNVALRAAVAKPGVVHAVAMLSPGLEYRGVGAEDAARAWPAPLLLAAGRGDVYAADSAAALEGLARHPTRVVVEGKAHGTALLHDAAFRERLLAWLAAAA